ncbi:Gamma-aminobutyric acid receptor subunit beta-3 [Phytophthora citrophthora]|uniref:Gamma-aminobutyric acid receptor subunit beta-3 n=1 Tax=Phytophthora citrophthora TaxID=4793 RepID=A0AAD9GYM2_9STRA|nr:Gamma-aminobutyric acid receptor subunit beta-3 [Phytophthora citrophthora]
MKTKISLQEITTATVEETQSWSSIVLKDKLTIEHVAVDIGTDREQYHLHLELEIPIPDPYLANAEYLTLTWPVGGIWKILHLSDNNRKVHCMSWRKTELNHFEVEAFAKKVEEAENSDDPAKVNSSTLAAAEADDLPATIFPWKMQLGKWGHKQHWFLRDIMPPHESDSIGSNHPGPLTAHLMAGFSPLEVQIEVNAVTSVDTVGQTFTADVTWEVTMPAITTIREDSVLRELMDILEFDENQFEFSNINSMQDEREMTSSLSPAGPVHFTDSTSLALPVKTTSEYLSHLQFSRRVVAVFSEEMTLRSFPVDQQKLTFAFSTGTGVRKSLRITPGAVDAGTFAIANYKLGNVFDVVYHDKVFVGEIDAEGDKKVIRFEMMLERKPEYYVTNVAIPAGIITYLCFISYAPLADGSLMDTGDRVQIVLTLLLTAVTFKSEVASLTPQISYFTTLDQYVFFCFIISCLVTIENALFPLFVGLFPSRESWQEHGLLGFSIGAFTLVNIVWFMAIVGSVKKRTRASEALIRVHEAIRVVSASIPPEKRESVLKEYVQGLDILKSDLPTISCTEFGYLHVRLPVDKHVRTEKINTKAALHATSRQKAERDFDTFKGIYERQNPSESLMYATCPDSEKPLKAAKPNEAFLAGGGDRRRSVFAPMSPVGSLRMTRRRAWSRTSETSR